MPQLCSLCRKPRLAEVDSAILAGEPTRAIAARFDVSRSAVSRHARNCLKRRLEAEHIRVDSSPVAPAYTPRNDSLAAYFEAHRVATMSPVSTLREYLVADLARLDAVMDAAIQSGSAVAVLAVIRARWNCLDKSGLAILPDKSLRDSSDTAEQDSRGMLIASMAKQSAVAKLISDFFQKLGVLSPDGPAQTGQHTREALAALLGPPENGESNTPSE